MSHILDQLGGPTTVANLLGITPSAVVQWRQKGAVPIDRCVEIERLTDGAARRWHLRPADWHRIWPELVGAEGAPAVPVADEVRHAA